MNFVVWRPSGDRLEERTRLAELCRARAMSRGHHFTQEKQSADFEVYLSPEYQWIPSDGPWDVNISGHDIGELPRVFLAFPDGSKGSGPITWGISWKCPQRIGAFHTVRSGLAGVIEAFDQFLSELEAPPPLEDLGPALESISVMWRLHSKELGLDPIEQRIGDALATLLGQMATVDNPPSSIVMEVASWFKDKLDIFATEFSKSAGKSAGSVVGLSLGAGSVLAATHVGDLVDAVKHLWSLLSK